MRLFQVDINNYIAGLVEVPTGVKNLADLITFNTQHADLELIPPFYTSQSQWALSSKHETCMNVGLIKPQIYRLGSDQRQCVVFQGCGS